MGTVYKLLIEMEYMKSGNSFSKTKRFDKNGVNYLNITREDLFKLCIQWGKRLELESFRLCMKQFKNKPNKNMLLKSYNPINFNSKPNS